MLSFPSRAFSITHILLLLFFWFVHFRISIAIIWIQVRTFNIIYNICIMWNRSIQDYDRFNINTNWTYIFNNIDKLTFYLCSLFLLYMAKPIHFCLTWALLFIAFNECVCVCVRMSASASVRRHAFIAYDWSMVSATAIV